MERFALRQNIARFEALQSIEKDGRMRDYLAQALGQWRRQLAVLEAERSGGMGARGPQCFTAQAANHILLHDIESTAEMVFLIHPGPGLHIVETSASFAYAALTEREFIVGRKLFDAFPDEGHEDATGVSNLYASIRRAIETGKTNVMPLQRYDVQDRDGGWIERFWQPSNIPIFDESGRLLYIMHRTRLVHPA